MIDRGRPGAPDREGPPPTRRLLSHGLGLAGLLALLAGAAAAADALDRSPLEELIRSPLSTLKARASVHAIHVPTGTVIGINADEVMNTASVIKIPIMMLQVEEIIGRIAADRVIAGSSH